MTTGLFYLGLDKGQVEEDGFAFWGLSRSVPHVPMVAMKSVGFSALPIGMSMKTQRWEFTIRDPKSTNKRNEQT